MNTEQDSKNKLRGLLLAAMIVASAVAVLGAVPGAVEAGNGDIGAAANSPFSPDDVASGDSDESQKVFTEPNDLRIENTEDVDISVRVDVSDLNSTADLSDASVTVNEGNIDGISEVNVRSINSGTLFLSIDANTQDVVFNDNAVVIDNIDTTDSSTTTGLEYTIRVDHELTDPESGDFSADGIQTSDSFDVALVEVENLATETTETVTGISEALGDASGDVGDTNNLHDDNEDVVIRLGSGDYNTDSLDIGVNNPHDQLTIEPIDDSADVNIINQDGGETFEVQADDLIINDITFDQDGTSQTAISASADSADFTVDSSEFVESNNGDYITTQDDAETEITGSTFEAADGATSAIDVTSNNGDGSLTVSGSTLNDTDTALDLSASVSFDSDVVIENNSFNNNIVHVNDDQNSDEVILDTIFSNNEFDQFAIIVGPSGDIIDEDSHAIHGDLAGFDSAFTDAEDDYNTGSIDGSTTIISAGEHDADNIDFNIDQADSEVVITSPSGDTTEDVVVSNADGLIELQNNVDNLEVSGISFQDIGNNNVISHDDSNPDTLTNIEILNNEFLGIGSGSNTVIDLSNTGSAPTIQGIEVSDNVFDGGNNVQFTAVDIGDNHANGDFAVVFDDNEIERVGDGEVAFGIESVDSTDEVLEITNNEILNVSDDGTDTGVIAESNSNPLVVNSASSVTIDDNTITGDEDGDVDVIDIDVTDQGENVEITSNVIRGFDGNPGTNSVALKLREDSDATAAVVEGNTFDANAEHVDFTSADVSEASDFIDNNQFNTLAFETSDNINELDDLNTDILYGTIDRATGDSAGNIVNVRPGVYEEDGLVLDTGGQDVVATAEDAADTTIVTEDSEIAQLDADVKVDGFRFTATSDSSQADVRLTDDDAIIANSTFEGPGDLRTAIEFDAGDGEVSNVTIAGGYETGIDVSTEGGEVAKIRDSQITGADTGILLSAEYDNNIEAVRNTIQSNNVGVNVQDGAGGGISINFNDIIGNENAGIQFNDGSETNGEQYLANFYGDNAPTISEEEGNDIVVDDEDDLELADSEIRPWLTESFETLPEEGVIVVDDPSIPSADGDTDTATDGAQLLVATLEKDEDNFADGDITFDISGPESLSNVVVDETADDDDGEAADPLRVPDDTSESVLPSSATPGDYSIRAIDTSGGFSSNDPVTQVFSAAVNGVEVTSDKSSLVADGDTEANVTLQLTDGNGTAVPRSGIDTTFTITDSEQDDADITITGENNLGETITTDANGQTQLTLTAGNANETFDVIGSDTDNSRAGTATIETVDQPESEFVLSELDAPSTIVQNESYDVSVTVSNEGEAAGTQDIDYALDDNVPVAQVETTNESLQLDSGESTTVTFEVEAGTTNGLETGDFTHVISTSGADDATLGVTVEEADETVTVGGEEVPSRFTTTTENGETTVTANNAIGAIDAFRDGNADVSTVLSVIDAFREESSQQ